MIDSGDIGMTQEQIDAMLSGAAGGGQPAEPAVGDAEITALADFERDVMGNLPSVLNAMTGFEYTLGSVEITKTSPDEIESLISDDLIFSFPINVGGETKHYLIMDPGLSKSIAASLMGSGDTEEIELSEMELSAITEVISQANGTYLTNLAAAIKQSATGESVSKVDVAEVMSEIDDSAMLATLMLEQKDSGSATIRHLITGFLASKILDKIQEVPEPAVQTAPEPTPAPPQPAPQGEPAAAPPVASGQSQTVQTGIPPTASGSIAPPQAEFSPAVFGQLSTSGETLEIRNLDILMDVPLHVTVELGKTSIPIKQILEYGQGSLITLDKLAGEPIDLLVNGKYFAKGEVVVIDENFGVRITSILSPAERIAQLS